MPSAAARSPRGLPDWLTPPRVWTIAAVLAAVTVLLVPAGYGWVLRAAAAWDAATVALVGLPWWGLLHATPATTRRRAASVDPGRVALLFSAVGTSTVALVAAV